jgi:hypothetical protein
MISNERPSPYGRGPYPSRGYGQSQYAQPIRPHVNEDTLMRVELTVERKIFTVTLKENLRGRFLRITEDAGTKRNTVIIPATGLDDFRRLVAEMTKAAEEIPTREIPPAVASAPPPDDDSIGNR